MRKKRSRHRNRKPVRHPSLEELAAVLEQIANMEALPLAAFRPPRRRRRRCAT